MSIAIFSSKTVSDLSQCATVGLWIMVLGQAELLDADPNSRFMSGRKSQVDADQKCNQIQCKQEWKHTNLEFQYGSRKTVVILRSDLATVLR